nr:MAG TPA: hypothetical protein [Bacteriophage sp.]
MDILEVFEKILNAGEYIFLAIQSINLYLIENLLDYKEHMLFPKREENILQLLNL